MTVPIPDAGRPATIAAGGSLALTLEFEARSVKVDNPTVQWIHLLDTPDGFVPPGQMGAILPIPGLSEIRAVFEAPPGVSQQASVKGQQAIVRAYSFWMPPNPGSATLVQAATAGPATSGAAVIGTSAFLTPPALTLPVPPGTLAVGYEIQSTIGNLKQISIVGSITGRTYVSDLAFADGPPRPVLIDPADTSVVCTVTPTNNLQAVPAVDFIAWNVPVVTRPASGATDPTQGPQQIVEQSLAAAGTATLVAGVANQLVRLWGYGFLLGGGAATATRAFLEETTGGVSRAGFATALAEDSKEGQRNGAPVGALGAGLQLHVTVISGGSVFSWAAVSQG